MIVFAAPSLDLAAGCTTTCCTTTGSETLLAIVAGFDAVETTEGAFEGAMDAGLGTLEVV